MQILKPIISSIYSFIISVGLCLSILAIAPNSLAAQNLQLPLNEGLKTSSEKLKVKLGASYLGSTFKIKIGDYTMDRAKKKNDYSVKEKNSKPVVDNSYNSSFSTVLTSHSNDTVFIEVEESTKKKEIFEKELFDFFTLREYELLEDSYAAAAFLKTNRRTDEQWVLLLTRTTSNHFSAKQTILTNGTDRITFKYLESEPAESIWKSNSEGIELYLNNMPLAALRYKGNGYRQYVWVSNEATNQQKLIVLGSMAAVLELLDGARWFSFEE